MPWQSWTFWQFSADGNGQGPKYGASGSQAIDLNRFNGDEEDFRVFTGQLLAPEELTLEDRVERLERAVEALGGLL